MMVESEGLFQLRATLPLPAVAVSPVGTAGGTGVGVGVGVGAVACGVAATYQGGELGAAAPVPLALTARILYRYSVPLVSPLKV